MSRDLRSLIWRVYAVACGVTAILAALHFTGQHRVSREVQLAPLLVPAAFHLFIATTILMVDLSIAMARWCDRRNAWHNRHVPLRKAPHKGHR